MARHYRRRLVVSCGNCGANFGATGPESNCPVCDASVTDFQPGKARPAVRGFETPELEGPDLMHSRDDRDATAPPEDFVAAGLVLLAFVAMVAGVAMRSPTVLTLGMALFALAGIAFGLYKAFLYITGRKKKREDSFEGPSMMEWMVGRGFWDRWR